MRETVGFEFPCFKAGLPESSLLHEPLPVEGLTLDVRFEMITGVIPLKRFRPSECFESPTFGPKPGSGGLQIGDSEGWLRPTIHGDEAERRIAVVAINLKTVRANLNDAILIRLKARQCKRPAQQIRKLNASRQQALAALGVSNRLSNCRAA